MYGKYEYPSPTKLEGNSGVYFAVPESVVFGKDMGDRRVTVFSFISVRRGLDLNLTFTVNGIVEWSGRKPDKHKNGTSDKFTSAVSRLVDDGYLTLHGKLGRSSCTNARFNLELVLERCKTERFAIIYLDELEKILSYRNPNKKDSFMSNEAVLLVFAYLRMKIFRRRNRLFPEETNVDDKNDVQYDIETRKAKNPEAYSDYYCDIAENVGLSERSVSKSVEVLNELGLIYSEPLPRVKHDGKWKTTHTLFSNAYKREGCELLHYGIDYYLPEIENKKRKLKFYG